MMGRGFSGESCVLQISFSFFGVVIDIISGRVLVLSRVELLYPRLYKCESLAIFGQ